MDNIIDEVNGNKDGKILSLFGINGIGKTTLANEIRNFFDPYYDNRKTQSPIQKEFLMTMGDFYMCSEAKVNLNKHDFIDVNYYIQDRQGILLPELLLNAMIEKSFSQKLKYSNILSSDTKELDQNNEKVKFMKTYKKLENKLPKILLIELTKLINLSKIYFFNSTEIHNDGSLGLDKIQSIAIIIELISSIIEMPITDFLHLIKINSYSHIYELVSLKLYKNKIINEKEHLLELFSNIKILFENKKLLNFLIDFDRHHKTEIEKFNYIEKINQYNELVYDNFNDAYNLFLKYFPLKFNEIKLNRRYNSSLGVYIYDFTIKKEEYTYSTFNFVNNIGSEGEKNLINFLHVIIVLNSINKDNKNALILSDDSFDSFDNSNINNINKIIFEILYNNKHIYIHLTHNYEHFRIFNNFINGWDNMYLINRNKENDICFTDFSIKNDFYKDYLQNKKYNTLQEKIISLIVSVPNYRNIIELTQGMESIEYINATQLLHYKNNDSSILINLLDGFLFKDFNFMKNSKEEIKKYLNSNSNLFNLLKKLYNFLIKEKKDLNLLEHRIFLALYGRLLIEKTIITLFNKEKISIKTNKISSKQTGTLIGYLDYYIERFNKFNYSDKLNKINYLNNYLPSYFHTNYNEIAYLINLDMDNLIKGIDILSE